MDWEDLEALYWQFDAMHRGYGAWEGRPTNERDAFKRTVRRALTENVVLYAKQVDAYQQLMEKAVRFAREWQNPTGCPSQVEAYQFLQSPEVQARKEQQATIEQLDQRRK